MQVNNKPCHPHCTHGIGYRQSYVTRKPLASRAERIPGIALVETDRSLSEPTGDMDEYIMTEIGKAATYGWELEEGASEEGEEEGE